MSRYIVAFAIVALTGALVEPVSAAGGARMGGGMRMGGGFRGAPMMHRGVGPILRPVHPIAPRGAPGHAIRPHGIGKFHANDIGKFRRAVIPPSATSSAKTPSPPTT